MIDLFFNYSFTYAVGAVLACFSLIFWFFFKENKRISGFMQTVFFSGLLIYGFSLYSIDAKNSLKVFILARDLFVLGSLGFVFGKLASNKVVFLSLLILLVAGLRLTIFEELITSFAKEDIKNHSSLTLESPNDFPELLVELEPGVNFSDLSKKYPKANIQPAFKIESPELTDLDDYALFDVANHVSIRQIRERLEALDQIVEYTEINDFFELDPMESVPSKRKPVDLKRFGLDDPNINQLWGFQEMKVDELYQYIRAKKVKPKRKAKVFILDTGVDAQHEDLKANYKSLNRKHDSDKNGHGTHCAGIAGAVSNNKIGIASMTQNNEFLEITSIKVLADFGGGSEAQIIQGMITAADNGADVISMSLGGRSNSKKQKAFQEAVEYANKKGAIVIVAAGNSNDDAKDYSPANCPGSITVSAIDENLNRAKFSNYITNVDYGIAAPGVNIFSSFPGNQYKSLNGTSMAAPYVSGLVGIMKSIQPNLTTKEAHFILEHTGIHTSDTKATGKFIQPAKAIKAVWERKKN